MKYLRKLDIKLVKGEYKNPVKRQVRDPEQIYTVFKSVKDKVQETLLGVYLDDKLEILMYDVLSVGGEDVALILPEDIFSRAIVFRAKNFILVHNHPKGDPTPSAEDRKVIEVLRDGAKAIRKNFLDFIIIGDDRYWSMFEETEGGEYSLGSAQ